MILNCINLERAKERREAFENAWHKHLGFCINFHDAMDRRDVEHGAYYFDYDEEAAVKRIGRTLSSGEIACATSHGMLIESLLDVGANGAIICEDDAMPLIGEWEELEDTIEILNGDFPKAPICILHKPWGGWKSSAETDDFVKLSTPPFGSVMTYYTKEGLELMLDVLSRMDQPSDWAWKELSKKGKVFLAKNPVARHDGGDTYVGNKARGNVRKFIK